MRFVYHVAAAVRSSSYPSLKDVAFHFSTLSQRIKVAARQSSMVCEAV